MKLSVDVSFKDIKIALNWFGGVAGAPLERRIKELEVDAKGNPFLLQHYREERQIEFDLVDLKRRLRLTGRLPKDDVFNIAYSFIVAMFRLNASLSALNQERLKRRLQGVLNDDFGFRPLAYEVSTAVHVGARGYELEWADALGIGNFDLLAKKNGCDIEIECKTLSADAGRKVHKLALCRVAGCALPEIKSLARRGGTHLFDLTLPARLDRGGQQVDSVARLLASAINATSDFSNEFGIVRHFEIDPPSVNLPLDEAALRSRLDPIVGKTNYPAIIHQSAGSLILITASSEMRDNVPAAIYDHAKKAVTQFSGQRPAIIVIQLIDITKEDFQELLKTHNHLHKIAEKIFRKLDCVDSLAFTSRPTVWMRSNVKPSQGEWPMLSLHNSSRSFQNPEVREIFG